MPGSNASVEKEMGDNRTQFKIKINAYSGRKNTTIQYRVIILQQVYKNYI
jgi:hypothetical protein